MNNKYPWKQGIITGVVVGVFAIISFSIADGLNKHFGWGIDPANIRGICGLLTLMILGTGIYTGMQSIKRQNNGKLTYKQAILGGMLIALITGVIVAILSFIYCQYINPGYAGYMIAEGKSQGEIAAHTAELQKEFSTPMQVMQALVGQTVCGTVISLVMALFVRSKSK